MSHNKEAMKQSRKYIYIYGFLETAESSIGQREEIYR